MRALARTLQAIERMLDDRDVDEDTTELPPQAASAALHLLDVKRGSARYPIAAERRDHAIATLQLAGAGILSPLSHEWTIGGLSAIEELSAVAKSLGCVIEFRAVSDDQRRSRGEVLARIEPSTYAAIAAGAYVKGESSTFARVERVGGATEMRCGVRLPSQPERMVFCTVESAEVVRQLGQFVYQSVAITGQFTWLRPGWRVRHILVRTVAHHRPEASATALDRLRRLTQGPWSAIRNPTTFVAELRSR